MLHTYTTEADLCEVLGPAYPASGVFDEVIRDRQPKENRWTDGSAGAEAATDDRWELTFRHLADGRDGHVVARQLNQHGHRTGRAIPMTEQISATTGALLRDVVLCQGPTGPPLASPLDHAALGLIQSSMQRTLGPSPEPIS